MRYLIVNGDDFGWTRGINRGILEAHGRGILTSTSLMVDAPGSEEAARLSRAAPDLSVGLHVVLRNGAGDPDGLADELRRQLRRFEDLMGCLPTHLDAHHHAHRDPRLTPFFLELAALAGRPLRDHSAARVVTSFYGRWGGETHPEQIGVEGLTRLLEAEVREGVTELCCHPGRVDPDLCSSYSFERELELECLCDPAVPEFLKVRGIHLVGFRGLERVQGGAP